MATRRRNLYLERENGHTKTRSSPVWHDANHWWLYQPAARLYTAQMFGMKYTVLVSLALISFSACLGISTVSSSPNSGYSVLSSVSDGVDKSSADGILTNQTARENSKDRIFNEVTGRNSKRGGVLKKIALPLLLLFGLKTGIAVPLVFGTVALAAFKGLWSGLTALVVTAALALRGLLPPPRIVQLPPPPPPHHAHITDYYTDYRRADELSRVDDYRYGWK